MMMTQPKKTGEEIFLFQSGIDCIQQISYTYPPTPAPNAAALAADPGDAWMDQTEDQEASLSGVGGLGRQANLRADANNMMLRKI